MNQLDREFIVKQIESVKEQFTDEISELAHMTAKGFERVDRRFEVLETNMNSKFDGVNRRLE